MSEKKEPQNTEQGIMNFEGKENFIIQNSLFDIRYSSWGKLHGAWIPVPVVYLPTPASDKVINQLAKVCQNQIR